VKQQAEQSHQGSQNQRYTVRGRQRTEEYDAARLKHHADNIAWKLPFE
jgi:hypothetical protein